MKPPPRTMRLNAVPKYLKETYNLTVSSRSVRNWVELGLRRETLETRQVKNPILNHRFPLMMVTTAEWVDQFITRCQIPVTRIK